METLLDRRTPPGRRMGHWDETAILIAYRHGPRASELCTHVHAPRRRDHLRRPDCSACCASHAPGIRISSAMIIKSERNCRVDCQSRGTLASAHAISIGVAWAAILSEVMPMPSDPRCDGRCPELGPDLVELL